MKTTYYNYKYRLFTNANQERELARTLETHRRLWNTVLDGKMLCWETANIKWSFVEQCGWLTIQRKTNKHLLVSKAESAGCRVEFVDPKNTSQECSACGRIVRKSLAVRVHKCECGCELDRDHNAAKNILARAAPESHNVDVSSHGSKSRFQLRLELE